MAEARIGRPRSKRSQEAVLRATQELLQQQGGGGLTIEAIARLAGVGKPTIYRWWPSMADIVLEVLLSQADADIPVRHYETFEETLRQFLRQSMRVIEAGAGVHLRYLMAQAQQDASFRERFQQHFTAKRREVLCSMFQQAVDQGQVGDQQDLHLLVDVVFGAMWYRLLVGHAPLDEAFADELTRLAVGCMGRSR